MSRFGDTFYYLALLNPHDAKHARAVELSTQTRGNVVTTAWVLTELADGMAIPPARDAFTRLLTTLRADSQTIVVPAGEDLFDRGLELYRDRPDKEWSLTDCISFVVMREQGIMEALTGDHHFEQAGFVSLLS